MARPRVTHRRQDRGSDDDPPDSLVPDPTVCRELAVSAMTMWRWDRDAALIAAGWPPPIRIRNRKFRSRRALESFKAAMAHRAIAQRANTGGARA